MAFVGIGDVQLGHHVSHVCLDRAGAEVEPAGDGILVVAELSALALYDAATDSALATVIATSFMLPTLLIGVGFTVAGVALVRQGAAGRAGVRWLPAAVLAPGVYVFAVFIPAINGPDFAAASSLMQLGQSYGDQLLSLASGGLVLLGYIAAFVILALRITPRRDVL